MKKITGLLITLIIIGHGVYLWSQSSEPSRPKPVELYHEATNWSYSHYQGDRLAWEGKGKKALLKGEAEIKASDFQLIYHYLSQENDNGPPVEELINFTAEQGLINKLINLVGFRNKVHVKTENQLELRTEELTANLETQAISSTTRIILTQPDLIITGTGLSSQVNLDRISIHKNVETLLRGNNLPSFSLSPDVFEIPVGQEEEVTIRITCTGPLEFKKIQTTPGEHPRQRINFKNQVVFIRQTKSDLLLAETRLYADDLEIILTSRPVSGSPETESVVSRLVATGHVRVEDGLTRASCHRVSWNDSAQQVFFAGDDERLAQITRAAQFNGNDQANPETEPAIILNAQLIETRTAEDIFILKGKKEAIFFNQENKAANQHNKIYITAKKDAIICLKKLKAFFKETVRVIQKDESTGQPADSESTLSVMKSDQLTLLLDDERNEIKNAKAMGHVLIINKDGSQISGKMFEWEPMNNFFKIKSDYLVKVWHQNNLIKANEIIVYTNSKIGGQIGNWSKIEAKNRNGTPGVIKIPEDNK